MVKSSRLAAVAALSCVLVVSGCSGSETGADIEPDSPPSSAADESAATSDGVGATADAGVTTAAPSEGDSVAVMGIEQAESTAIRLLTSAESVREGNGKAIEDALAATYRGRAREAAAAADELEVVTGKPKPRDLIADPITPNVLAISREDGRGPDVILVQTVPETGPPILYLMTSPQRTENFRITWSAQMLAGTEVGTFDRRSLGSPVLRDDARSDAVAQAPASVLEDLAGSIDYPGAAQAKLRTNGYAPAVRKAAAAQAEEVSRQADFTETNSVSDARTRTLLREDGSAITFALLERESTFDIKSGMELTPPEPFVALADDESLTDRASLDTAVFVAMTIPAGSGRPEMIAATEQIVGASGS